MTTTKLIHQKELEKHALTKRIRQLEREIHRLTFNTDPEHPLASYQSVHEQELEAKLSSLDFKSYILKNLYTANNILPCPTCHTPLHPCYFSTYAMNIFLMPYQRAQYAVCKACQLVYLIAIVFEPPYFRSPITDLPLSIQHAWALAESAPFNPRFLESRPYFLLHLLREPKGDET